MSAYTGATLQLQYSDEFTRDSLAAAKKIRAQFMDIINYASNTFGVDPNIPIAFILVEDPELKVTARSPAGAIGLLQMTPATAFDYIKNQAPKMPAPMAVVIEKNLPGFLKPLGFVGFEKNWSARIATALQNPEFNIWVGICGLAQMMWHEMDSDGNVRLDHVIIKYNAGAGNYHKYVTAKNLQGEDTETLVQNFPFQETDNYLIKMLGIGGALQAAIATQGN